MFVQLERALNAGPLTQGVIPSAVLGVSRGTNIPKWRVALKLYSRDQVVEANEIASSCGAGDLGQFASALQIIGAEAETSRQSEITRISEWLEVEQIPDQQPHAASELGEIAEQAIKTVWAKIGLRVGLDTLITFLAADIVLPIHVDTTGYVTAKKPYAKYCLPASCSTDLALLNVHVQMLAACHAAAIISGSMAPPWLLCASEAIADIAVSKETRYGFCSGGLKWLEPSHLNSRLLGIGFTGDAVQSTSDALDQALLIGRYLIDQKGIKVFRDCLAYHSPASIWHHFLLLFSNDPTRDVCKKLYGYAPEYLFERALADCCK